MARVQAVRQAASGAPVHYVIVFLQGINSEVTGGEEGADSTTDSAGRQFCPVESGGSPAYSTFACLKLALKAAPYSYKDVDFLEFSYPTDPNHDIDQTGYVDGAGAWQTNGYACADTGATHLEDGAQALIYMMTQYGIAHPESQFIIVGHSLGGDIAFQALSDLVDHGVPPSVPLKAVMTIDSQLEGTPLNSWNIPWTPCGATGNGILDLNLKSLDLNSGKENASTVTNAHGYGVKVFTIGNQYDTLLPDPLAITQTAAGADSTKLFSYSCDEAPLIGDPGCGHLAPLRTTDAANYMASLIGKQHQDNVPPGGLWVYPKTDGGAFGDTIDLQAEAYDNRGGSGVQYVNFTANYNGAWHTLCSPSAPTYDDVYTCDWTPTGVPASQVTVSFDVYDNAGNVTYAPNGEHTLTYAPGTDGVPPGGCPTHVWVGLPYLNTYYDTSVDSLGNCVPDGFYTADSTFGNLTLPAGRPYYMDANVTITGTAMLSAGSTLQVSGAGNLHVAGTLSLGAGSTVQFPAGDGNAVYVTGTLNVNGTASQPVRFLDSSAGQGQWDGIAFYPGSTGTLTYLQVTGGGGCYYGCLVDHTGTDAYADLLLDGAGLTITNSSFTQSEGVGLEVRGGANPTLTSDTFTNNNDDALYYDSLPSSPLAATSLSASGNGANALATGGGTILTSLNLGQLGVSFIAEGTLTINSGVQFTVTTTQTLQVLGGDLDVAGSLSLPAGSTLPLAGSLNVDGSMSVGAGSTLQVRYYGNLKVAGTLNLGAGSTVQFPSQDGNAVYVTGTLNAAGTASAPVRFLDSTAGQGQWEGIAFYPGSTGTLTYLQVTGGGGCYYGCLVDHTGTDAYADLLLDGAGLTITNSSFTQSEGVGLEVRGGANPTLTSDTFTNNNDDALYYDSLPSSPLAATSLSASGNGANALATGGGTILTSLNLGQLGVSFIAEGTLTINSGVQFTVTTTQTLQVLGGDLDVAGSLSLPAGSTLPLAGSLNVNGSMSVGTGSTLQVRYGNLKVAGTLNLGAGSTVQFPSQDGNAVYVTGTLNAAGTASAPVRFLDSSAGQWEGIAFYPGSTGTLTYLQVSGGGGCYYGCLVDHTGAGSYTDLLLDAASPTITDSSFTQSAGNAVEVRNGGEPILANDNFGDPVVNDAGATAPTVFAACDWWGDPSGPSGAGTGGGVSVSAGVSFTPWATSDPTTGPSSCTWVDGQRLVTGSPVNLTAEGSLDWAQWGATSVASFNHKANVAEQISNYALVGSGVAQQAISTGMNFTWTDGTPTTSAMAGTGVYVQGAGSGFSLTVPAATGPRTLRLYVAVTRGQGRLSASVSGSSLASYLDTSLNDASGTLIRVYVLPFASSATGQSLTVSWTLLADHGSGSVSLLGAALSGAAGTGVVVTSTPTATVTATSTGTATATTTASRTPTTSVTMTGTASSTVAPSATATGTATAEATATLTASSTASNTPMPVTSTGTMTATPTISAATWTRTSTPAATATTITASSTPVLPTTTATPTNMPIPPTGTWTGTPTPATRTATHTPVPPTSTRTGTAVPPTSTATSTNTTTMAPTYTQTNTPIPPTSAWTNTAVPATRTATHTPVPPTSTRTSTPAPLTSTATWTNTPIPPTSTQTSTAVPPTSTATHTPVPPTNTSTRTATPVVATSTATATPSSTATNTAVPATYTATNTTVPPTNTPTRTNTPIPPANTATSTGTATATPTSMRTNTPVPPTVTATHTPVPTSTASHTPVPPTSMPSNTAVPPTRTVTSTSMPTSTPTSTPSSTVTSSPTGTNTPSQATSTHTPKPTSTVTPGGPTSTATSTPSSTATLKPTSTNTQVGPTSTVTATPTSTPSQPTSTHTPKPTSTWTPTPTGT